MGVCLISAVSEAELRTGFDAARKRAPMLQWRDWLPSSSPSTPLPKASRPAFPDAGKPRAYAAVLDGLKAAILKARAKDPGYARLEQIEWEGRIVVPGWAIVATDGCVAVCAPTNRPGGTYRVVPFRPLGTLPAEAWRDYARVRLMRNERSNAVRWTWGEGRLTWDANHPEYGSARGWYPWAEDVAAPTITLNDDYLYPLHGCAWTVDYAGPDLPIVFAAVDRSAAVVIMGMRY